MKKVANSVKDMNSSEEEYCALLLLAKEEKEAAIPKKDRRILVQQHFEMRPVLVEFNTTFRNLMNYFNHPCGMSLFIINTSKLYPYISPTFIQIEPRNSEKFDLWPRRHGASKLDTPMTHPGPTTFGEDRHLSTWEEYGDKQENKQTNVT